MKHLTYLIGAGASANVLPVNNQLIKNLEELVSTGNNHRSSLKNEDYLDYIHGVFFNVIEKAKNEFSIDTLAKITEDQELSYHIKVLIWLFFSINSGNDRIDPRYKHLISKFNDKKNVIRNDVSFISWNYDLQIEEAVARINGKWIDEVCSTFKVFPGYNFQNPNKFEQNYEQTNFSLVHLNGCAGYYYDRGKDTPRFFNKIDITKPAEYDKLLEYIINVFYTNPNFREKPPCSISFASEKYDFQETSQNISLRIAQKTTHLVVIGYSFPDYNKDVDRKFLASMNNLEYLCIQDKKADWLKNRILEYDCQNINNLSSKIKTENETEEFWVPGSF